MDMSDYTEYNIISKKQEVVTPENIVSHLINCNMSGEEAIRRIHGLLNHQKKQFEQEMWEMNTLVGNDEWKDIYDYAKDFWARYDGIKPTGESLTIIKNTIKEIIRDDLKLNPTGTFKKLTKYQFKENRQKMIDLLDRKI